MSATNALTLSRALSAATRSSTKGQFLAFRRYSTSLVQAEYKHLKIDRNSRRLSMGRAMTLNQLLWTGLAIASTIDRSALAWEPGEPLPKAQCGPKPATIGQDATICQAKDSEGNQHLSVNWSDDTPPNICGWALFKRK